MSIESIATIANPGIQKHDGFVPGEKQGVTGVTKQEIDNTEMPEKAVKSLTASQEEQQLKDAADKTNQFVKNISQQLEFSVDKDTGKTVVKVIDRQKNEVIRQIPPKEMLEIAKALDMLQGLIIREKA
jgi:flagellar protein FlaG